MKIIHRDRLLLLRQLSSVFRADKVQLEVVLLLLGESQGKLCCYCSSVVNLFLMEQICSCCDLIIGEGGMEGRGESIGERG